METETTTARRITGLTISCDHCPATATHRSETPAAAGFAVHWTCRTHTAGVL